MAYYLGTYNNDDFVGTSGDDIFDMGPGGGSAGTDTIDGGAGTDTVIFPRYLIAYTTNNPSYLAKFNSDGSFTFNNIWGITTMRNVEFLQFDDTSIALGTSGNDTMGPKAGIARYYTGAGNDTITPGAGVIYIDGGAGTDRVVLSGTSLNYVRSYNDQGLLQLAGAGSTYTLKGVESIGFSDGDVTISSNTLPVVSVSNVSKGHNQTVAASSLFTVSDADDDTITAYEFRDNTTTSTSGHFVVAGVAQAAGTAVHVTAAQLAQVSFVTGFTGDNLDIRAFDGTAWSAPDSSTYWANLRIDVGNTAPVLTTSNITRGRNQTLAVAGLFAINDADGDTMTAYELLDSTSDPNSGHFVLNGVVQAAGTVIDITAAQMAQTSFVTGTVGDNLQIRAFDGAAWSAADRAAWSPFRIDVSNTAPVVATADLTRGHSQTLAASGLFSVSDADSDAMTAYELWDGTADANSGHFVVAGVVQASGPTIHITAAQLAQTSFVTGTVGDRIQIRAFDGNAWSAGDTAAWSPFRVNVPANTAPVVTTSDLTRPRGQTLAASSLFSVSDADSDAITAYELWDGTGDPASGHFVVNGVVQAAGLTIHITAAQLAQTSFVTGAVGDRIQIRAFDGAAWSASDTAAWSPFVLSVPVNHLPVVTTADVAAPRHQTIALSDLFTVSDADSDAITRYQLWDSTRDAASGHFVVNGVAQNAGTVIDITAAQLAQTSFVTGTVGDNLQIRAYDGTGWSAADNAAWAPFNVTLPVNHAPVVTTSNAAALPHQTLALSSLFSVSDADSDTITAYQLWDSTRDAASGHFVVGGVAQAAGAVIDITAAQLAQTSFVTGTVGDNLQIRAYDGAAWSAADNAAWSPFNVTLPVNHPPAVTTSDIAAARRQTIALSDMFTVSDADSDTITRYQLWDSNRDAASGHFVVGGVAQAASTIIDITAAQLAQTSFVTGIEADRLQIRAYDGAAWSAADDASWSPFNVTVPANHAPVVTTANITSRGAQTLALSSLISVSDADSDAITAYELWDGTRDAASGHFVVNGVTQAAGTIIDITAAQLAQTSFVTGSVGDALQIRASDGAAWSAADNAAWSPFTITVPFNHAPVVTMPAKFNLRANQTVALSSLFSVSDADSDAITEYQFHNGTDRGYFVINGVVQSGSTIDISAAQLSQSAFEMGFFDTGLQVRAYDGSSWSAAADPSSWASSTLLTIASNHAPAVTTSNVSESANQTVALSSLFSVSDPDGDTIREYQLWDSTRDAASGHFVVNGVAQAAGAVIDITAAQLAQTSFLTGTMGDDLQIRANDGLDWSASTSVSWAPFHVSVG